MKKIAITMTKRFLAVLAAGALLAPSLAHAQRVEYYHLDGLGSVRAITDEQGEVVERHDYLPFGEEWNPEPGSQPRKFTGKERDEETGWDYFGARYYEASLARFTAIDPVTTFEENRVDPQRWNRYAYVRNNPLRYVDPNGKIIVPIAIGLAVAFVLNNVTVANVTEGPTQETIVPNSVIVGVGYALAAGSMSAAATTALEGAAGLPNILDDSAGRPTQRFNRQRDYGGAQTRSGPGRAAREAGEGTPCPGCGEIQVTGTRTQPVPEHSPSLLEHYYERGGHHMTDPQRRTYARSSEAFDNTRCLTCQRSQGAELSRKSQEYAKQYGLKD